MSPNLLITGAAGYIGGSLVADFLASNTLSLGKAQISAAVRSDKQAKALSHLGVNVLQMDLTDGKAVLDSVLHHGINIVIHTASSLDPATALHLLAALSKQREISGEETYFIHTSALGAFCEKTGWPQGESANDTFFNLEKRSADTFPIRQTDVTIIEQAKALGVTSFVVIPSTVYGRGSGEWNKLSVVLPMFFKGMISQKQVYRFAENTTVPGVHISDLTALYAQLVQKILQKETIPSGTDGYYFALAHGLIWWEVLDRLAAVLYARGLVTDSKIREWPSDEFAAEVLGLPVPFVQLFGNAGSNIVSENERQIGWKPVWNWAQFLDHIDDEVQDVLELGKAKSSLADSLNA